MERSICFVLIVTDIQDKIVRMRPPDSELSLYTAATLLDLKVGDKVVVCDVDCEIHENMINRFQGGTFGLCKNDDDKYEVKATSFEGYNLNCYILRLDDGSKIPTFKCKQNIIVDDNKKYVVKKTCAMRLQSSIGQKIFNSFIGNPVSITIKLDGTSASYVYRDNEFIVCSRKSR